MAEEGIKQLQKEAIDTGLCVECGACVSVCPTQAITLKEYEWGWNPEMTGNCPDEVCDVCYRVCPAFEVPSYKIEETFFGRKRKDTFPENVVGVIRDYNNGYALNPESRDSSYSGGVCNAVLVAALEAGMIDAAVVADFDPERPWRAVSKIATTPEEIIKSAGSKYQPHPHLLAVKQAVDEGYKKIAITAVACHADGIRKMQLCEDLGNIADRIEFVCGLTCATHFTLKGTVHIISKIAGVPLDQVAEFSYRAKPFPGVFQVISKDGKIFEQDFVFQTLPQMMRFVPEHCRLCPEKVSMFGDLTFGDVWHHPVYSPEKFATLGKGFSGSYTATTGYSEEIKEVKKGMSMVITRNEKGDRFLKNAVDQGYVKLYPQSIETCYSSTQTLGRWESTLPIILKARKHRGLPYRDYGIDFYKHFKKIMQDGGTDEMPW